MADKVADHYSKHFRFLVEKRLAETKQSVQDELDQAVEEFSFDSGRSFAVTWDEISKDLDYIRPKNAVDLQGSSNVLLKKLPLD
ncbi:unnamed protein product [Didymodactylos carnosus]|uniref:Uncharacterized protein n=1 Tax=Didymodactylos carnosus TaxID=1234261 RepID=A0A8S2D545_9BILA|nr:unnamed protein product [Didymodactylos carnosus]CAF3664431.1 unnamed protein product [Didymodactylos carnosus]